jgi:hypothetical protein
LTSLDISDNSIVSETWLDPPQQGLKVGDLVDGKCINSIDEDDGQIQLLDLSGIKALADVIPDMRAISTVIVNTFPLPIQDIKSKAELDFSGKGLKVGEAIVIAALIPSNVSHKPYISLLSLISLCDKGAISSINLLKNDISAEQAQGLVKIMQAKEKLVTLCGLGKEETELDFSGQDLGAGDAVLIANDISDMGAMTSLNLASNKLGVEGAKIIATSLPKCM